MRAALDFIGAGRAARSPAVAAHSGDVVFLTVPDRMIRPVCEEIAAAKGFKRGAVVIHCAGVHDASVLAAARERKALVAALHPLQSFATPEGAVKAMKGTCFTFDGDEAAAPVAEKIVEALGGRMVRVRPEGRALYHAASCVLSNYLVAVADLGMIMLILSGMDKAEAARAARPLLAGTVENIGKVGVPGRADRPDLARRRGDGRAAPRCAEPAAAGNPAALSARSDCTPSASRSGRARSTRPTPGASSGS